MKEVSTKKLVDTIVEGIQNIDGTNAGYVHGDNAMVIVISNDLNLVKKMAQKYKTRIELRSPDSAINPYIAFSLIIGAGLYGIENSIKLFLCTYML